MTLQKLPTPHQESLKGYGGHGGQKAQLRGNWEGGGERWDRERVMGHLAHLKA